MTGLLARAGVDNDLAQTIMVPGLLVIAAATAWGAYRLMRAGRPVATLLVLAVAVSAPISVTHHWTGIIVAVALLVALLMERRPDWPTLIGVTQLLAANVLLDNTVGEREPIYRMFEGNWLLSNLQGFAGILCLVLLLVSAWKSTPRGVSAY